MLSAKCRIKLDKLGQDVVREGVTPAEASFFAAEHHVRAGGVPVEVLGEPEEIERSSREEIARLYSKYPAKKIKALFPSVMAGVPESFPVAIELGMGTSLPSGKLMEFQIN